MLRSNINESKNYVATAECPKCSISITQCTLCDRNIDTNNHNGGRGRSALGYMKIHVKKSHENEFVNKCHKNKIDNKHGNQASSMHTNIETAGHPGGVDGYEYEHVDIELGPSFDENFDCQ